MTLNKMTLVVMAAGMGSRYGGIKQLDGIGGSGETILEYGLYDALSSGFDDVVFIIRKDIEQDFRTLVLKRLPASLSCRVAFQTLEDLPPPFGHRELSSHRVKPWGTAQAVWCVRDLVKNPFAVINADDFYGRSSYHQIAQWLKSVDASETQYALVGYSLENTLSDHGTVSRGVCETNAQGFLNRIEEHVQLVWNSKGTVDSLVDERVVATLGPQTTVSMNMFGFTPPFFGQLEQQLRAFLEKFSHESKKECYLPAVIGELLQQGQASVQVIPCNETWFGVTYQEDRPEVVARIKALVGQGLYPESLWKTK